VQVFFCKKYSEGAVCVSDYWSENLTGISATHTYDRTYQCLADQKRENARINPRDVGARGADSGLGIESSPKQRHF